MTTPNSISESRRIFDEAGATELETVQKDISRFLEETPTLEKIKAELRQTKGSEEFELNLPNDWKEVKAFFDHLGKIIKIEDKKEVVADAQSKQTQTVMLSPEEKERIKFELEKIKEKYYHGLSVVDARYTQEAQKLRKRQHTPKDSDYNPKKAKATFDIPLDQLQQNKPQNEASLRENAGDHDKVPLVDEIQTITEELIRFVRNGKGDISHIELPGPNKSIWKFILSPDQWFNDDPTNRIYHNLLPDFMLSKENQSSAKMEQHLVDALRGLSAEDPNARNKTLSVPLNEFKLSDPGHLGGYLLVEAWYSILRGIVEWQANSERQQYAVTYMTGILEAGFDPNKIKFTSGPKKEEDPDFKAMVLEIARARLEDKLKEAKPSLLSGLMSQFTGKARELIERFLPEDKKMAAQPALPPAPSLSA